MAVVRIDTFVETVCVDCGQWSRTHHDHMTCAMCFQQTAKRSEYIEVGIVPDVLTTDDESF